MGDPLQDRRPLKDWAAESQVIEFSGNLESFDKLAAAVKTDLAALGEDDARQNLRDYEISGWVQFSSGGAHGGRPCLTGRIEAAVPAACQRCLSLFRLPLLTELRFELIEPGSTSEDLMLSAEQDGFEAWELDESLVRPADIVDEALVMALPLVAKHDGHGECIEIDDGPAGNDTTHPFASLRAQMDKDNKD